MIENSGGPAGLLYGFFLTWFGTLSVFIVMGELASMIPTAGGQYHWVSVLAPKSAKRSLSYLAGTSFDYSTGILVTSLGWLTVAGWVGATTAISFWMGSLVQAMLEFNVESYVPQRWHGTLLFWGALLIVVFINTVLSRALPIIEVVALILRFLGFFAIIVPLNYLAPKSDAKTVFTTFRSTAGYESQALAFFIGLNGLASAFVGTIFTLFILPSLVNVFAGTDGPVHVYV